MSGGGDIAAEEPAGGGMSNSRQSCLPLVEADRGPPEGQGVLQTDFIHLYAMYMDVCLYKNTAFMDDVRIVRKRHRKNTRYRIPWDFDRK